MTEVRIRDCRIEAQIDFGTGFFWTDELEQRALAERVQAFVLSILDELLEPHLPRLASDGVRHAIRLDLRLNVDDLNGAAPLARRDLRDRVEAAIAKAIEHAVASTQDPEPGEPDDAAATDQPWLPDSLGPDRAMELLLSWHGGRQLEYRLALMSDAVLTRLVEIVLTKLTGSSIAAWNAAGDEPGSPHVAAPKDDTPVGPALRQALQGLLEVAATASHGHAPDQATSLDHAVEAARRALRIAADAGIQWREFPAGGPLASVGLVDDLVDPSRQPKATVEQEERDRIRKSEPDLSRAEPAPPTHASMAASQDLLPKGRLTMCSALPFLALQRLASHGILAAASACNQGSKETEAMFGLAFAIALRSQDLPSDNGRWSPAQLADAALMAGRSRPLEGPEWLAAAQDAGEICDAAAGAVGGTLIAGHKAGLPLPLLADAGRLVVFESEGIFPLCRLSERRIAEAFAGRSEVFFIADPDARLLRAIEACGLFAIASGPPTRAELWRQVAGPRGWRGMTNLSPGRLAAFVPGLPGIEQAARRASEVWNELTVGRPLAPELERDEGLRDFDRMSALLAGFALADIAWTLSRRDAEAWAEPDPLLAVQRFADLSATVEVTPRDVIVSLPLGIRFAHLRDAGLLERFGEVPWWPGRTIAFEGG
jgi:hypothetical protein